MKQDQIFKFLVLQGIWMLVWTILHGNKTLAHRWRINALAYMDEHGNQSEKAAEYRREIDFKEIP